MGTTPAKRLSTFADVHLYCVTMPPEPGKAQSPDQSPGSLEKHYRTVVEAACAGGADAVQLRDKTLSPRRLVQLCKALKAVCERTGTLFIVNDRVDVALAAEADGVHLGQDDVPLRAAREMLGHRRIIGCSTHTVAQAIQADGDGADYVSCGPVYATPTKPDYAPVGLDMVKHYRSMVRIPFVAIGGIDPSNVGEVVRAGADRVAVVRAAFAAQDVQAAVRSLKEKILQAKKARPALATGR